MKYFLFLLFVMCSKFTNAQQINFTKAGYLFYDTTRVLNTWWRDLAQSMAATVDTTRRQMIIPNFQLWANTTTRRNIISGQSVTTGDTTLSTSGTLTIKISGAPIHYTFGTEHIIELYLQDGIKAIWWGRYLAITFPRYNGYNRQIELE